MTYRARRGLVWAGLLSAATMLGCGDDGGSSSGGSNPGGASSGGSSSGGSGAGGGGTGATGTGATGGSGGSGGGIVAAPAITDLDPDSGIATATVTVSGSSFGATQGASTVTIGGETVTPTSWADDQILFDVPTTLFPSTVDVVVTVDASASNALPFDVLLPRTVYINNDASPNTVSAFAMDAAGALTAVAGSPYAMGDDTAGFGGDASSITVHRGTRRVFATSDTTVAVFDIDPVTGALTAVAGSPFATNAIAAYGVTVNAAGTRIFVANYVSDAVSVFNVAADGALSHAAGSPHLATTIGGLDTPQLVAGEGFLTVTDENDTLSIFSVDAGTGALTEIVGSPFPTAGSTFTSRMDPTGTYLFVPDYTNGALQVFDFDGVTGLPSQVGAPVAVPAIGTGNGLAFTPDGARVYHAMYGTGELFVFDVQAGIPTEVGASPFLIAGVSTTSSMAVTRDGAYLATAHEGDAVINVHSLAADGTPTLVVGAPFAIDDAGTDVSGLAIAE